jgi:hypothetical protein
VKPHVHQLARNEAWKDRCTYKDETGVCRKPPSDPIHVPSYRPVGAARAITCPFRPHGGTVWTRATEPRETIEQHAMVFAYGVPDIPGMLCPASLMGWPLNDEEKAALTQQARDLSRHYDRDMQRPDDYVPPGPAPVSQSVRQPGRMGREPEPGSEDWALGGREDEDVPHHEDVKVGTVPAGVGQHPMGRGVFGMEALAGPARQAMELTNEARMTINDAKVKIDASLAVVQELLGDSAAETLSNWVTGLTAISNDLANCRDACTQVNEFGTTFIGNLYN